MDAAQRGTARTRTCSPTRRSRTLGVQHPLEWIPEPGRPAGPSSWTAPPSCRRTASTSPSGSRTSSRSRYKLLGYPTGVGCLVARREALAGLRRPWFAGGTIATVSVQGDWHTLADGEARFEDGTLNYLALPAVEQGLALVEGIGIGTIHTRVRCLTEWLLDELAALRHANGRAAVQLYGPRTTDRRGGTITFNLVWPDGRLVDIRIVERRPPLAGSRSGRGASATRARRSSPSGSRSRTCAGRRAPKGPTSTCAPSASRAAARSVSRL